jgi:hypothetical protein
MANNPKKIQDPAESALSAIQEALGTSAPQSRPAATAYEPAAYEPAAYEPVAPQVDHRVHTSERDLFESPARTAAVDDQPPRRAANDDRQSIGMILQTLQRHPPKTSYVVASVFAFAWVLGGLILAFLYLPDLRAIASQGAAGVPAMFGLAAFVLAPVLFFYALAHMVWRAQELRLIAQSMAGVAMRLAEPEEVARESIVTVGQAIRREVAAMGDGVERAPPNSRPSSPTRSLRSSVPTTTTRSASAACSKRWRISATRWSPKANRSAMPSPACTST